MARRGRSLGLLLLAFLLGRAFVGTSQEALRGSKVAREAERKFIVGLSAVYKGLAVHVSGTEDSDDKCL